MSCRPTFAPVGGPGAKGLFCAPTATGRGTVRQADDDRRANPLLGSLVLALSLVLSGPVHGAAEWQGVLDSPLPNTFRRWESAYLMDQGSPESKVLGSVQRGTRVIVQTDRSNDQYYFVRLESAPGGQTSGYLWRDFVRPLQSVPSVPPATVPSPSEKTVSESAQAATSLAKASPGPGAQRASSGMKVDTEKKLTIERPAGNTSGIGKAKTQPREQSRTRPAPISASEDRESDDDSETVLASKTAGESSKRSSERPGQSSTRRSNEKKATSQSMVLAKAKRNGVRSSDKDEFSESSESSRSTERDRTANARKERDSDSSDDQGGRLDGATMSAATIAGGEPILKARERLAKMRRLRSRPSPSSDPDSDTKAADGRLTENPKLRFSPKEECPDVDIDPEACLREIRSARQKVEKALDSIPHESLTPESASNVDQLVAKLNELTTCERELSQKIAQNAERIEQVGQKVDGLETKLSDRLTALEARVGDSGDSEKKSQEATEVEYRLKKKLQASSDRTDEKMNDLESRLDKKIAQLQTKVDSMQTGLKSDGSVSPRPETAEPAPLFKSRVQASLNKLKKTKRASSLRDYTRLASKGEDETPATKSDRSEETAVEPVSDDEARAASRGATIIAQEVKKLCKQKKGSDSRGSATDVRQGAIVAGEEENVATEEPSGSETHKPTVKSDEGDASALPNARKRRMNVIEVERLMNARLD